MSKFIVGFGIITFISILYVYFTQEKPKTIYTDNIVSVKQDSLMFESIIYIGHRQDGTKQCYCYFDQEGIMDSVTLKRLASSKGDIDFIEIKEKAYFDNFKEANDYCTNSDDIKLYKSIR